MFYPDELIEEIRSANDIVDVISQYVRLTKKGLSYTGLCPFHNEKTPSFSVSSSKQIFKCFGCGAGGNVFHFLMSYENMSFTEVVIELAKRASITLPVTQNSKQSLVNEEKRARMYEANKDAANLYYSILRSPSGKIGFNYLRERGLNDDIIKLFGLGYSDKYRNTLVRQLNDKGYSNEILIDLGLIAHDEKNGFYDKFWNRIMFPIQNINGKVIGFGGRVIGDANPKYLNSPENLVFNKSKSLYGLNIARNNRSGYIILCEGYLDVISMHMAGFNQAVASLGTSLTIGQANLIKRYATSGVVYIAYDSDGAGSKATIRAADILREVGVKSKVVILSPYKDPDDCIKAEGRSGMEKRIQEAKNSFLYETDIRSLEYNMSDPDERTRFHRTIAKRLCVFTDEVERDNYIKYVSSEYGVEARTLKNKVIEYAGGSIQVDNPRQYNKDNIKKNTSSVKAQSILLNYLSSNPNIYTKIRRYISVNDFSDGIYKEVSKRLFEGIEKNNISPASIINHFEDGDVDVVASIFASDNIINDANSSEDNDKIIKDIILSIINVSYEEDIASNDINLEAVKRMIDRKKQIEEIKRINFFE